MRWACRMLMLAPGGHPARVRGLQGHGHSRVPAEQVRTWVGGQGLRTQPQTCSLRHGLGGGGCSLGALEGGEACVLRVLESGWCNAEAVGGERTPEVPGVGTRAAGVQLTSARLHREDQARLLEENANLKGRLAARAFQDVQAGAARIGRE